MKNAFRKIALALPLLLCGVTSCGESTANLVGSYSTGSLKFQSQYPAFTVKFLSVRVQGVSLYDDNTYVFTESMQILNGSLSFDPSNTGDADISDTSLNGSSNAYYYGEYTSTEEEGILTVTMKAPTRIVLSRTDSYLAKAGFFDTANWTETMGTLAGSEEEPATAEKFLADNGYEETTFTIDETTYSFNYIAGINKSLI